jgi:UDPglucose--hexose-1-phosphate uridylyltransferase
MDNLEVNHVQNIFLCIRDRILDLKGDIRFEYIQIFKNQGFLAGATIPHPHMQILALPIAPTEVMAKLRRARVFYDQYRECYYCHILKEEKTQKAEKTRVLNENYHFVVHAPFASRFPFQLTITPKIHVSRFEESVEGVFKDLAEIIKYTLSRINQVLKKPSFHIILNNPPLKVTCGDYFHWTLDILPVISRTGGFELATNCYINPYPPEEVVEKLKEE